MKICIIVKNEHLMKTYPRQGGVSKNIVEK